MAEGSGAPRPRGVGVDREGRCTHWRSPRDIVSIRLPCCEGFWACHACHEETADHPAEPWPEGARDTPAVLCGRCRSRLTIRAYLASPEACPRCGAAFNPRCAAHHPLYFRGTDDGRASSGPRGGSAPGPAEPSRR